MKKRFFAFLLAAALCALFLLPSSAQETPVLRAAYTSAAGTLALTGSGFPASTRYSLIYVQDPSGANLFVWHGNSDAAGLLNVTFPLSGVAIDVSRISSYQVRILNDKGGAEVARCPLALASASQEVSIASWNAERVELNDPGQKLSEGATVFAARYSGNKMVLVHSAALQAGSLKADFGQALAKGDVLFLVTPKTFQPLCPKLTLP